MSAKNVNLIDKDGNQLAPATIAEQVQYSSTKNVKQAIVDADAALENEIAVERARISNLATLTQGSTTGDAELIDMRVGADAFTYPNAGESVRVQISDVKDDFYNYAVRNQPINGMVALDDDDFEIGNITISASGWVYGNSTTRVRTKEGTTIPLEKGDVIGLNDYSNARFYIGVRRSDGGYEFGGWKTADFTCTVDGEYVLLLCNSTDQTQANKYDLLNRLQITKARSMVDSIQNAFYLNDTINPKLNVGGAAITNNQLITSYEYSRLRTDVFEVMNPTLDVSIDDASGYLFAVLSMKNGVKTLDTGWITSFSDDLNCDMFIIAVKKRVSGSDVSDIRAFADETGLSITVANGGIKSVEKSEIKEMIDDEKGMPSVFPDSNYISHLFIDKIYADSDAIIPCQSLDDLKVAKRLGFNIVEGNVKATATSGKYIVMHGASGNIGGELMTLAGGDASSVSISGTSFDDLRNNYVYRSRYEKYQTAVTSLEEFLQCCHDLNLTPMVQLPNDNLIETVKKYVGNNAIIYSNNRTSGWTGFVMTYSNISSVSGAIAKAKSIGAPCIYMPDVNAINAWSDAEHRELVQGLHAIGVYAGFPACYLDAQTNKHLEALGYDIGSSAWEINDFDHGNLLNLIGDITYDDFYHEGTLTDGVVSLSDGQWFSTKNDVNTPYFLSKASLHITFKGTLKVGLGDYINHEFTSDGKQDMWFSTYIMDGIPNFSLMAVGNVTITSCTYKVSKC